MKKFSFIAITALIVIIACELGFRFLVFGIKKHHMSQYISRITSHSLYTPVPYRIFAYRPGYNYVSSDGKRRHHINQLGLIGPETTREKAPDVYRILALGASTTANFENSDDPHTYPARLSKALTNWRPGQKIEVLNAGVRGYNTAETLIYFAFTLLELNPDMIIIYHGFNDLLPNSYPNFRPDYSHFRRPAWYGLYKQVPLWERVMEKSLIFAFLRSRFTDYPEKHNLIAYSTEPPPPNPYQRFHLGGKEWHETGFTVFERNLRSIISIARDRGIVVVLPTFAQIVKEDTRITYSDELRNFLLRGIKAHNERIRKLWHVYPDIIGVDLDREISGHPEYFFDFIHFNDAGSKKAASTLARSIRERLVA